MEKKFSTNQESFWAGKFGDDYIERNSSDKELGSRLALFTGIFAHTRDISSVIEFGANIGNNLKVIDMLLPRAELSAIEINARAVSVLEKYGKTKVYHQSILDFAVDHQRDFVFTSGVLIHMNPEVLPQIYDLLFKTSRRYVCIVEYYNPVPVEIVYRGETGKLFKRDFAGELLEMFSELRLLDYGFVYHRDANFPLDDLTWFLLEKIADQK